MGLAAFAASDETVSGKRQGMTIAPASEVIITIQFKTPVRTLNALEIARLYEAFSPPYEQFDQVAPAGPMPFKLTHLDGSEPIEYAPSMARLRFATAARNRVIMFQPDRFSFGWQRTVGLDQQDDYPGFDALLDEGMAEWTKLRSWFANTLDVSLEPNVAEIVYVNAFVTRTPEGEKIRLSQIYNFLNPTPPPVSVNGYAHSWNQRLDGMEGVLIASAEGPVITPAGIPATLLTLAGTFLLSSEDSIEADLLKVRGIIGETFKRVINAERRPA